MPTRRVAGVSRCTEGRRTGLAAVGEDVGTGFDALLATTGDPPLAWPVDTRSGPWRVVRPGVEAWLWCSAAWVGAVGETEAALDLAASADPVQWLERLEDRLLEACEADPGPYAALACWHADTTDGDGD